VKCLRDAEARDDVDVLLALTALQLVARRRRRHDAAGLA